MTDQDKKELEFITKTALKVGIGIMLLAGTLIVIAECLK